MVHIFQTTIVVNIKYKFCLCKFLFQFQSLSNLLTLITQLLFYFLIFLGRMKKKKKTYYI